MASKVEQSNCCSAGFFKPCVEICDRGTECRQINVLQDGDVKPQRFEYVCKQNDVLGRIYKGGVRVQAIADQKRKAWLRGPTPCGFPSRGQNCIFVCAPLRRRRLLIDNGRSWGGGNCKEALSHDITSNVRYR